MMPSWITTSFLVGGVAVAVAWIATGMLVTWLRARGRLDVPNHRSSHSVPTPRGGGLGILVGAASGLVVAVALGVSLPPWPFMLALFLVAAVGCLDDQVGGLPILLRLAVQGIAAGIVVTTTGGVTALPLPPPWNLPLGAWAIPLTAVWLIALPNLYNFLDGIDGYAGTQGVLAGLALASLGAVSPGVAMLGVAVAGGCLGFLRHNWHPARVFMGDVGSLTLGFIFAAAPLIVPAEARSSAVWLIMVSLWFFLADGTFTLLARLVRGERIWEAHRSHLYQRLSRTGLRHDQIVLATMTSGALLALFAIAARDADSRLAWGVLLTASAFFTIFWGAVIYREKRRSCHPNQATAPLNLPHDDLADLAETLPCQIELAGMNAERFDGRDYFAVRWVGDRILAPSDELESFLGEMSGHLIRWEARVAAALPDPSNRGSVAVDAGDELLFYLPKDMLRDPLQRTRMAGWLAQICERYAADEPGTTNRKPR